MKVYYKEKGKGKTTELIKTAVKDFLYMVVKDNERAHQVFRQAKEMGLDIPFPITFREFVNGRFYGSGVRGFAIDDVDMLVEYLARGRPVKAISLTKEKE